MLKGLIIGFILCFVLIVLGVYFYFSMGQVPVATTDPPMMFERKLAHMALDHRIDKEAKMQPPIPADEKNFLAGADVYKDHCAVCHGIPGREKSGIAQGMFPPPPELFKGTGVTDDPPSETYWKAKNGIRLTGMPGFKNHLSDTELWQVSLLLANADKIPDSVKQSLTAMPAGH
jgi:thiosulfate dehydrogenase